MNSNLEMFQNSCAGGLLANPEHNPNLDVIMIARQDLNKSKSQKSRLKTQE